MPYKKKRQEVYDKLNGHCAYCGIELKIKDMQIDHIVPQMSWYNVFKNKHILEYYQKFVPKFLEHLTENDLHHIDNLNPACRVCNKWKSAHYLETTFYESAFYVTISREFRPFLLS